MTEGTLPLFTKERLTSRKKSDVAECWPLFSYHFFVYCLGRSDVKLAFWGDTGVVR